MRLLVVEDERKVAAFLKKGLQEEGYTVEVAYDGEEAHNGRIEVTSKLGEGSCFTVWIDRRVEA